MRRVLKLVALLLVLGSAVLGTIFGTVRGIVHDPQHRPVSDAQVLLKAKSSDYTQTLHTDAEGKFQFDAVPLGQYSVAVSQVAFVVQQQQVVVLSGSAPILHFELHLETQNQLITVSAESLVSSTPAGSSIRGRSQIAFSASDPSDGWEESSSS